MSAFKMVGLSILVGWSIIGICVLLTWIGVAITKWSPKIAAVILISIFFVWLGYVITDGLDTWTTW